MSAFNCIQNSEKHEMNKERPNTIAVGYRLNSVDIKKLKAIREKLEQIHGSRLSKTQVIKMMINRFHIDMIDK